MSGLDEALAQPVTAIALCWRLARPDGVVFGFTSHDRDLTVDGVVYRARPGMTPSAVVQTDGLQGDGMSIEGVLDSTSITAGDLAAGLWSGAVVEVLACDWEHTDLGMLCLSRGRIGEIVRPGSGSAGQFQVELMSDLEMVETALPLRLSPTCRNALGDAACGVDLEPLRLDWEVTGGGADRLQLEAGLAEPERFVGGRVRFVRGPLCGLDRAIVGFASGDLVIDPPISVHGLVGGRVRLTPGCDKRIGTCRDRFANVAAFGGEPHVPGTDALLRYAQP